MTTARKMWYNLGISLEEKPEFAVRAYENALTFYQNTAEEIANDGMNAKDLEYAVTMAELIQNKIAKLKPKEN